MIRKLIVAIALLIVASNQTALNFGFQPSRSRKLNRTPVQAPAFDPAYQLSLPQTVQDKNFFLLSLFQRTPDVRKLLNQNKALRQLANQKIAALKQSVRCANVGC